MFSDYVDVSMADVLSQSSFESDTESESSENTVHEKITCATDCYCYDTFSDTAQRFANAQSQWPLLSARLKEKKEYLDSTHKFLDRNYESNAEKELSILNLAVERKRNHILCLRAFLGTLKGADLQRILKNREAELEKLEADQAAAKADFATLPEKVAEIRESRSKLVKEFKGLRAQERACKKELEQCSVEEKAVQVWEKIHRLCLCGLAHMEEKDLQVILLNLDAALEKQR